MGAMHSFVCIAPVLVIILGRFSARFVMNWLYLSAVQEDK